ncbi:hypothetical protein Nepgr_024861 [Nepenthes gracilis]|uniref:C2 domain-containing protein n=1 Tax=Nepenthes gracilis TaxID=150966 RepID=A0AAD3T535_NEPGR|nr:hypothetical protein Nepgr_024861 [Nepenthes gracilis]
MATVRKLIVEVVDARNLQPKDGHGTSSPYVVVDFYGQRKRTKTAIRDLNPTWNEVLDFNVGGPSDVFGNMLEIDIYHDKNYGPTRRINFLGRVRLNSSQFVKKGEEALMYFPLEKKYFLSWIQGELGMKIYYVDEVVPPPVPPPKPLPHVEEVCKPDETTAPQPTPEAPLAESETQPKNEPPAETAAANEKSPPSEPPDPQSDTAATPMEATTTPPLATAIDRPEPEQQPESETAASPPTPKVEIDEPSKSIRAPEVMASSVPGAVSQTSVAGGLSPPPPLPPLPTARNFSTASTESVPIERTSFDLVEKMHYIFVRVIKARSLPTNGSPVVQIAVPGSRVFSKPARKTAFFEWDQTFAFGRDAPESSSILEISLWEKPSSNPQVPMQQFLGGICFDVTEIPLRDPPDSPLAPQWYRLEGGGVHMGDLMLATWIGTQADESFPDAWLTDTAGKINSRAKVYLSPKLWYLRATVLEAQDILPPLTSPPSKEMSFQVRAQLGFQVLKTKAIISRNGSPSWNEDLMFVAAEPFSEHVVFTLEHRLSKGLATVGITRVPLTSIERRVDDRKVAARWFSLEEPKGDEKRVYGGRLQLRLCFDGGYHVMDEAANVSSDYQPTAKQLWKPPVGTVELGIIECKNLLPMKTVNGRGSTDAYAVAKYGPKWARTRTVSDSLDPRWNEQYTWKVYDPCTVLTVGVFDSSGATESAESKEAARPDFRIGKVRIRVSTVKTGRVYRNTYPLLVLTHVGLKKMGDIELAVRFVRSTTTLDVLHMYTQSILPLMHHIQPLAVGNQEMLRSTAVKIIAAHLSRAEPPLRREIVLYMLDADSYAFSMRKVRVNWFRIINVIARLIDVVRWIDDTRSWKKPTATVLVHALLVVLVWFPDLIVPTLAFYVFVVGVLKYRFRSRDPLPHFDPKISLAESIDREELDEEFDAVPSNRPPDVVRGRYDKLRTLGARVQTALGDLAAQGERVQSLVTWRDPRATALFVGLCLVVAVTLYLVPSKVAAMALGFYYLRHPLFRDRAPSPALNFFRRLPSQSDRIL